jgi:hypothetical protein
VAAEEHLVAALAVKQAITGFHQDDQGHWVAELACGHNQHVRHDPPWQVRPWVITAEGRRARLGEALNCVLCDEAAARKP